MNNSDASRFKSEIVGLGELYGKKTSGALINIYWMAFESITIEKFTEAVRLHVLDKDQGMFFPKPAHLLKHIESENEKDSQSVSDRAELAWASIYGQISTVGSYNSPVIEDKQALATVKGLGGWVALCSLTVSELVWRKKEFLGLYDTYENTPVEALPSSLPGRIELHAHKTKEKQNLSNLLTEAKKFRERIKDGN
jgi:hypothetical protein